MLGRIKRIVGKGVLMVMELNLRGVCKLRKYEGFHNVVKKLNIDLNQQYTEVTERSPFSILKLENQHAFQIGVAMDLINSLMERGVFRKDETLSLVDIGDSAGTHLKYLRHFLKGKFDDIKAVSVNLDPVAVDKINRGGGTAVLCRAEEYSPEDSPVSLYLSFQMVEHLHNPALFFHRMALTDNGKYMVITVPYVKKSRVSLLYMENKNIDKIYAEAVHVFELNPKDWGKIALHSGWKTIKSQIYYQYPENSLFTPIYKYIWRRWDYEGFLGLCLERDMTQADKYQDWEG